MKKGLTYAEHYEELTGHGPLDSLLAFYSIIEQYDTLNSKLDGIKDEIENRQERASIQQSERDGQRGIRIFRRIDK